MLIIIKQIIIIIIMSVMYGFNDCWICNLCKVMASNFVVLQYVWLQTVLNLQFLGDNSFNLLFSTECVTSRTYQNSVKFIHTLRLYVKYYFV